jgi:hypothetical protein
MSGLMGVIARTVKSIDESGKARYELHIGNSDDEFGGSRLAIKSTSVPLTKKDFDNNFIIDTEKFDVVKVLTGETSIEETYADAPKDTIKRKSVIG